MKRACFMCRNWVEVFDGPICGMCVVHVHVIKKAEAERDKLWPNLRVIVDCPSTSDELDDVFFCFEAPKELP